MVLEGNVDVLQSLRKFYQSLSTNQQFPPGNGVDSGLESFLEQIDSFIYDSRMHIARGQLLAKIVAARKVIVRSSVFLLLSKS